MRKIFLFLALALPTHITIFHGTEIVVPDEVSSCICSAEGVQRLSCHLIQ